VFTFKGIWVSNRKWQDRSGAEGLRLRKKSRVEVDQSWSQTGAGRMDGGHGAFRPLISAFWG